MRATTFLGALLLAHGTDALLNKAPSMSTKSVGRSASTEARGVVVLRGAIEAPADETPAVLQAVADLGITAMRLGTCVLMVHHGFDKIQNVDGFSANVVAKFFGFLPGPPQFWTLSAAATQIAGAGLLGVGVASRPVAASMMATMITAVVFHLLNTGPEDFPLGIPKAHSYNFELAAMYVLVLGYFTVAGAGKYSVDEQILGGEINFYKTQYNKLAGGLMDSE